MARISCVICAYNEADRIEHILNAVVGHPDLAEVIVVNDGSTDATEDILRAYPSVRVISYPENRGKTYALGRGIAAAQEELIMLLDADLAGVTRQNIAALAWPVLSGRASMSISLRRNSLPLYRLIGLDFVSGERVIPRSLLRESLAALAELPRWGGEVYMNQHIVQKQLRIAVVRWDTVYNIRKRAKLGAWQGFREELRMVRDACSVLTPYGTVKQNIALLALKVPRSTQEIT